MSAPGGFPRRAAALGLALAVTTMLAGCTSAVGGSGSASPPQAPGRAPTKSSRPVDPQVAQRLQRVMTPLIKGMDRPVPLDQVKVGILDDNSINAASAGEGQFFVTRGLLERATDQQLAGVLAHELAHDDLNHVAKAQALGAGLNVGMIILDQIFPGSGAITPIAGKLVMNRYTQSEEYAADRHGVEILQRAGMPTSIMADTLAWLQQTDGGSSGGFFATHPATGDRIEALRKQR